MVLKIMNWTYYIYFKIIFFFPFFVPVDKTPNGFPVITVSPNVRVIEMGHTAVMQCKATGNPPPEIYWLKDTKRVDMGNKRYTLIAGKYNSFFFFASSSFYFIYLHSKMPFEWKDRIWSYLFINFVSFYFFLDQKKNRFV